MDQLRGQNTGPMQIAHMIPVMAVLACVAVVPGPSGRTAAPPASPLQQAGEAQVLGDIPIREPMGWSHTRLT